MTVSDQKIARKGKTVPSRLTSIRNHPLGIGLKRGLSRLRPIKPKKKRPEAPVAPRMEAKSLMARLVFQTLKKVKKAKIRVS